MKTRLTSFNLQNIGYHGPYRPQLKKKKLLFFILMFASRFAIGQTEVSTASLLREMISAEVVTRWPHPLYQTFQASSYDRKSVAPDQRGWYANADASQYIREEVLNGRREKVMMDEDGPGAIVRFWLTTFKRKGTLRIYFDHQKEPEITIPAYDLMKIGFNPGRALLSPHSSYETEAKGGSTLYLPMPYLKHCKVTFEEGESEAQPRYYQINFRKYAPGTLVKTFTRGQIEELGKLLEEVNNKLLNPANQMADARKSINEKVLPGKSIVIGLDKGSRALTYLQIQISSDRALNYPQALRSTILQMEFDNAQTVWCPVGDFSGSGVGGYPLQSWYRTVGADSVIKSRWIMPYERTAKISILNTGSHPVNVRLLAVTSPYRWDKSSMYFHAAWKGESGISVRKSEEDKSRDWNLTTITGKGVFMGESLAVYNYMHAWYGEGDQKLWVDNAGFPAEFGTGAEDYYNTSWAPVVLYQTPFANAPRADRTDSFGHNTFTRTRNLDAVPFTQEFKFDLEMLGWQNGQIDAGAVTYWYGFKGAKDNIKENTSEASKLVGP